MATVFTEVAHTAEFILSEAAGQRSRENGTVVSGQDLKAGTVVEEDVNGKLTIFEGTTDSGAGLDPQAIGILIGAVDASAGDVDAAYIARDAEVNVNLITHNGALAETTASLLLLGIITR